MRGARMREFYIAVLAGAVVVIAGSATAADLGPRPVYEAQSAVAAAPVFSWSGPYVGLFAGKLGLNYRWGAP